MSKAANIYWDDTDMSGRQRTIRRRRTAKAVSRRTTPWWLSFLIAASIFTMLLVSINFRAFTEARQESQQNERLSMQIQSLMDENLALQEEIHRLKTDPRAIQLEAKRLGIGVREKQVLGPVN